MTSQEKYLLAGGVALVCGVAYVMYNNGTLKFGAKKSIYERIGGDAAIQALVDIAIPALREDPELKGFFDKMPLEYHKKMQFKFFVTALGGPVLYDGKNMKKAHEGRGITKRHFDVVVNHVVLAMQELNVPEGI